jgi:hypothetical protein
VNQHEKILHRLFHALRLGVQFLRRPPALSSALEAVLCVNLIHLLDRLVDLLDPLGLHPGSPRRSRPPAR